MKSYVWTGCCIAVFIVGLVACSSEPTKTREEQLQANITDLHETLHKSVQDTDKLHRMLAVVDQKTPELQRSLEEFTRLRKEQVQLNANYNATLDEFRQLDGRIKSVRMKYRETAVNMRTALAQLSNDDEWKKITSRDLAIFKN
jgi:septal ring factor EnvC (AmiA/AmiB activator)